MSRSKTISFPDAVRWLQCNPPWLTKQIEAGRVSFTLENDGKGANRYVLSRDDIECLIESVPVFKRAPTKEVRVTPTALRKAFKMQELRREAAELGMTVDEYEKVCR